MLLAGSCLAWMIPPGQRRRCPRSTADLDAEIGRASLIDSPVHLLSPLVASTDLLCGLAGVEFSDHQKYTIKWAFALAFLIMGATVVTGAFSLVPEK